MNSDKRENIAIEITTGTIFRAMLLAILLVFLYLVRDILVIVLFAVVIASAIEPIAHWGARHRIPRVLMVLGIYAAAFSFLGMVFYLVVPTLFSEFLDFISSFSSQWLEKSSAQTFFGLFPNLPETLSGILTQLVVGLQSSIEKFTVGFFHATAAIFGGAFSFILVVVISFYLSVQEHGIEKFLQIITPKKYEKYAIDLWLRSQRKIGFWLQGQVLLGVLIGIFVFLGLTIIGIKYALMLALLATVLELIPIFGPVLAAIPAVGVAFLQKPSLALVVIALYVIIQQFESHLIHPVVVRKITGVPPILVIIAMIIGGKLGGISGVILAIPISVILVEFLNDMAARKELTE
ncbi:MAG: AI-2E family transporter [Candidatus Tagabacteria bacterium]